jgi:hypothetical protein
LRCDPGANRSQRRPITADGDEEIAFVGIPLVRDSLLLIRAMKLHELDIVHLGPGAKPAQGRLDAPRGVNHQPQT